MLGQVQGPIGEARTDRTIRPRETNQASWEHLPGHDHGLFQLAGEFRGQLIVDEAGLWEGVSLFSRFVTLTGVDLVQDAQQT